MNNKKYEATKKYRKTPKGVLTNIYHHCKSRRKIYFTLKEFHEKYINDSIFLNLFSNWVKSDYNKMMKPVLDRIDCFKDYSFDNVQWLTWKQNREKENEEFNKYRNKKVYAYDEKMNLIKIFKSQKECCKYLGVSQGNVSQVLKGTKKCKIKGFVLKYENPELIKEKK